MSHNMDASNAALDLSKHLITVSSAAIALSATVLSDFTTAPRLSYALLVISWLSLGTSIVSALRTVSTIVMSRLSGNDDWSVNRGRTAARLAVWGFVAGLSLFALFALVAVVSQSRGDSPAGTTDCVLTLHADAQEQQNSAGYPAQGLQVTDSASDRNEERPQ